MNIWITSDWHIGHFNIIRYCDRPFKTVEEMNETIIKRYNHRVRNEDVCYFLGDNGEITKEMMTRMNGKKILIVGNHDKKSVEHYYNIGFYAVLETATLKRGHTTYSLSHYPKTNLWNVMKIFIFYTKKMLSKGRTFGMIWNRMKKEWNRYRNIPKADWYLCGHRHKKKPISDGKNIDCGVDGNDFYPISIKRIEQLIAQ